MAKPKTVQVRLMPRDGSEKEQQCYAVMDELIAAHHEHLAEARIALVWRSGIKADNDGHTLLGRARKVGDLDRELQARGVAENEYDFAIILNKWTAEFSLSDEQLTALIDHELCHCGVSMDANGDTKTDSRGRPVYRIRKHDVEEFASVVERHGLWKDDLARLVHAARGKAAEPLLAVAEDAEKEKAGEDDAWRGVRLADLSGGLPEDDQRMYARALKVLAEAEEKTGRPAMTTLGELEDWRAKKGQFWAADIHGIGDKAVDAIDAAVTEFWMAFNKASNKNNAEQGARKDEAA